MAINYFTYVLFVPWQISRTLTMGLFGKLTESNVEEVDIAFENGDAPYYTGDQVRYRHKSMTTPLKSLICLKGERDCNTYNRKG